MDDTKPWSILWTSMEVDEFLFASSDMKIWLIVNREKLMGLDGLKRFDQSPLWVTAGSYSCQPFQGDHKDRSPSGFNILVFSNRVETKKLSWGPLGCYQRLWYGVRRGLLCNGLQWATENLRGDGCLHKKENMKTGHH